MLTQHALHIDLSAGHHDLVEVAAPHFIGPVEYAWDSRNENDPTILGVGPLAGRLVPGANGLLMAGRSLLWDGFYPGIIPGAGLVFSSLGCDLMALRGKTPLISVLLVENRKGTIQLQLDALDPEPLWHGTHDGDGTFALLHNLAARYGEGRATLQLLVIGPAAARTRFGSICSARVEKGRISGIMSWLNRGGFGSRLYHEHGLCALVLATDQTLPRPQLDPAEEDAFSVERFPAGGSVAELESAVRFEFNPKLKGLGTFGATFDVLRQQTFWFNASSVLLAEDERDELYRRALRDHYLVPFVEEMRKRGQHHTCGEPCPLACKKTLDGRLREFETYAALGPLLGIADHEAADRLTHHGETLGFDPLTLGGILGWIMERLHLGLANPVDFGLSARPRWTVQAYDPVGDSQHNAQLAQELSNGLLFSPWGAPFHRGLRPVAQQADTVSSAMAIYNANGDHGEMSPYPFWSPGFFTPMPISSEFHQYYGLEFVPPRVLGRKSAQRMTAELMLQNFGICRLHRGWAEEQLPELINRHLGTTTEWLAFHRKLAQRIYRRRKARFWETTRVIDIIVSFLQHHQYIAAPDSELDRWVRRFREEKASAARAFWSEINAGIEEILGG